MTVAHQYPMDRTCPFDPPPEVVEIQSGERIVRVRHWDGTHPWLITGYNQVRAILTDPRVSADTDLEGYPHPGAGLAAQRKLSKNFINMDRPEHDRQRLMLTRDFMTKRMQAMRPRIQEIVDSLIDEMLAGPKPVDLVEALALPVPSMVICDMLGVSYDDRDLFHDLSRTTISRLSTPEQAVGALNGMLEFMGGLVDQKSAHPGDDLISRLVTQQLQPGHMTRDEVVQMCQFLLVAGHETTANMIALGTLTFLERPEALAEVRDSDDPAVVANAVEEMLRYLTIFHVGRRRVALEDFEFEGNLIKTGDGIIADHAVANRDPEAFDNPHVLDITRKASHHLAFGYGVHQCLGQPLARVELNVVYSTLYRRIPTLRLAIPLEDVSFKSDNVVYGVNELPVTW